MTRRRLLRIVAIAIAVMGAINPMLTRESSARGKVSVAIVDADTLTSRDGRTARGERAWSVAEQIASELADDYDVSMGVQPRGSRAAACPAAGQCIVVSDGAVPARLTDGAEVIGAVRLDTAETPRLQIVDVQAPQRAGLHSNSRLQVRLRAVGARGNSDVRVFDGDVLAGEGTHSWPDRVSGEEAEAVVPINWAPVAAGSRRLRVVVSALEGEETLPDNEVDRAVEVMDGTVPVLIYEPEASWLGTFVRRALEDDPRFQVHGRTRIAPTVAVSRGASGVLTRQTVDAARTVVVTRPDLLTNTELDLLEHFMRVRGGSLLLLPDRRPTGRVATLVPPIVRERREGKPVTVGELRASDLLIFSAGLVGTTTLASADGDPIVVSRAMRRGRLIVSGALDAWRFRDAKGAFAGYWTGLVADAVAAAGQEVEITLRDAIVAPGDRMEFSVEWQTMVDVESNVAAEAAVVCGNGSGFARLWPEGRPGLFSGTLEVNGVGQCDLNVSIAGAGDRGSAPFLVSSDVRHPSPSPNDLAGAVTAHGGVLVDVEDKAALIARVRRAAEQGRTLRETRPMRSPWWIVPFAACLSAEWWLRRRAGLR